MKPARLLEACFGSASAAAAHKVVPLYPRLGRNGEISEAYERDMTLLQWAKLMRKNWRFTPNSPRHEGAHAALAALSMTHPELMKGKPYQGDYEAEIYVEIIQSFIETGLMLSIHPLQRREVFIDRVLEQAKEYYYRENFNRLVSWMLAQKSEKSAQEILIESSYYPSPLQKAAEAQGVVFEKAGERISVTAKHLSPDPFIIQGYVAANERRAEILPEVIYPADPQGKETLIPFKIPSREEVGRMYDAFLPALHLFQEKINECRRAHVRKNNPTGAISYERGAKIIGNIRFRELVARLYSGALASNEPCVVSRDAIFMPEAA